MKGLRIQSFEALSDNETVKFVLQENRRGVLIKDEAYQAFRDV